MHVVLAEPLPADLLAFFHPARSGVERVDVLGDPTSVLTELEAPASAPAAERARHEAAWRDLARYDRTIQRRLRALAALAELRAVAGNDGLRLWDPRLETACALADAALARWRASGAAAKDGGPVGE